MVPKRASLAVSFLCLHLPLTLLPALDARIVPFNAAVILHCARCYQDCSHPSPTKVAESQTVLCTWCANAFKQVLDKLWQMKRKERKRLHLSALIMRSQLLYWAAQETVENLIFGFWQASYMASCGSLHLVDHASEGPGHCGGPLS